MPALLPHRPGRPLITNLISSERVREIEMKTYTPKASEIEREWHVVDAEGLIVGRLATVGAHIERR